MRLKGLLLLGVLLLAVAIAGCGKKEMVTTTLKLDTSETTVSVTYPKEGFSHFWGQGLGKDEAQVEKFKKYRKSVASDFSSVLVGPKYSIVFTNGLYSDTSRGIAERDASKTGFKEVTYGGNKGYQYLGERFSKFKTEAYTIIVLPYDPPASKRKQEIEVIVISHELLDLTTKVASDEIKKDDPAVKKAIEENKKLMEDKELQAILNSIKIIPPK